MTRFHVAQINIARMRAPIESDVMLGFASRLASFDWSVFQPCPAT